MDLHYVLVGFDYTPTTHTETVICHAGDPIESLNSLMRGLGEREYKDARVLRDSDSEENDRFYYLYDGWKRNVPNQEEAPNGS